MKLFQLKQHGRRWIGLACSARLCAALGLVVAVPAFSMAQESPPPELTAANVESWADEFFTLAIEENRISGAVVSMVQDGSIVLERGYGQGNVLTGEPANPSTTRVRIGSTTKTFTATLVAELLIEGRIGSIDDPVNDYSKRIQLPDNDGVPITLRHLLTHTAGFEDRFFHIGAIDPVEVPAAPEMIESLRPGYARPAGTRIVYSNFGVALLGWVIEDIVGEPIDRIMSERLFDPIGMNSTELAIRIDEPEGLAVPAVLDAAGVVGPTPFTAINPAVAQTGSIVSTAHDMALYMNAQLGESALLSDRVINRLRTPLAGNAANISQIGMVYFLDEWAGQSTVSHGGNWAGFHTWMLLLPDQRSGLFISLLSEAEPRGIVDRFLAATFPSLSPPPSPASLSAYSDVQQFMTEFFGPKRGLPDPADVTKEDLREFAGLYRADRRSFTTTEALSSLVYFGGDVIEVSVDDDGLDIGAAGPWVPEGDGSFVLDVPTRPRMVFASDHDTGSMVLAPDIGIFTYTRIDGASDPRWQAVAVHMLVPLTMLGLFSVFSLRRNRSQWAPFLVGLCGSVLVICATVSLGAGDSMMTGYFAGRPLRMECFMAAANLQLLASLATAYFALRGKTGGRGRLFQAFVAVLGLAVAVILAQYNIIGLNRI